MAEENKVVESVCGENKCIAQEEEGNILELLTEAVGYDVWEEVEGCTCEANLERIKIRHELHANPEIDTSKADNAVGEPEPQPPVEEDVEEKVEE